jgi:ribosome maturation factor RimP
VLSVKEQKLLEALEPQAATEGIEIVTIEIKGPKKAPTIRVYIDTEEGVGFDELCAAQKWIDKLMDRIDPFEGAYTLEVTSPGIDRPLRTPEHFKRFLGQTIHLVAINPIDGRSKWTGTLIGVQTKASTRSEEETGEEAKEKNLTIALEVDGINFEIPFQNIKRANIIATIDFNH